MATGRVVKWPKIFLYGDSLTQFSFSAEGCWGALVADHFQRRADVVVRGFSGYNSRQCRALLPYVASDLNGVVAATIFLGANDASEDNSKQAISLKEYAQNLKDIVAHFQQLDVSPIVITPPVLDGESWQRHCGESGKLYSKEEELTTKYAHTCADTAASLKVPCIDLHTAMINQDDWKSLLCDGLHFSRRGSELLASLLIPTMERLVVGRVPSHPLLPPWDTIHPDPATTFTQWCTQHSP
ncbi:hypothetical protein Pmani_034723 [Petrolisthes manimaculis]|uniref:SGNH hydrolase-type esterase domain-containing protein n=1 Tax=Petrolisthes manimaculis TaxID=1843537 RepID=A0AAE1NNR0_9EUCA|nr:hypothetical protein Pmani_034723 [Petrolisthes manimaculis]